MAQDPFQGWGGSQGGAGTVDPFGEFPFQMPTQQPQQQQQPQRQQQKKQFNAPQDPAPLLLPQQQQDSLAPPAGPGGASNTSFMPPPHGGGGADLPGARTSNNNSGFPAPATQNPFETQALNTGAFHTVGGAAAGGGGASRGVAGGLNEASAGTNSGAGVVEDLFGVAGGEGPGAMVPYGQQQPLESHPLHQHHHHHGAHQQQHPTYQGAIVPFQQQQQHAGGSGGTSVTASNPFDDLLGGVSTAVGTGSGAGILQQQHTQQPQQQQWPGHPFAGSQQQYPQQQHHHHRQQSWLGQGGAARNGDATADGGLQLMQPQYPPHQQQLQIAPAQQPLQQQQQQLQTVAPGNPFFHAAPDLPQQQQKAPGADLFGDDPFGSVNSGSKGPPPVPSGGGGGGSSADAVSPFDFDAVAAAVPAVSAAAATGRRVSGGSAGSSSAGDERRRGGGGSAQQQQQQDAAPGGRGRPTTSSSSSGGRGRAPPSTAGELPARLSRSSRSRSVSVPRGTAAERGRGSRPLSEADPFGSNSGRHGAPPSQSAQQQGQGGRASRGSTGGLSRRNSFGATSRRGTGKGALAGGGGGAGAGGVGGGDFEGDSGMMRTASGGSLRGVGGYASRNQRQQQQRRGRDPYDNTYDAEEDDDEREGDNDEDDDDDDDAGYDSDTMSVMDQDAIRASMRKRGARGTAGAGGRRGDTVDYIVEFERARKLGMLLERHDEWPDGREKRSERAIVKMVVDSGPAKIRGVTVGSKVKRVNGDTVEGLTYQQTLECIKNAARPLRVEFERGQLEQEDNVGQILFKKTVGVPRSYSAWQRRYFVLGGAVAKVHVLQVYVSKQSYDRMVLAVFENRRINERVKAYKLSNLFKCGPIKVKSFKGHPTPLYFFTVKLPKSRLKQLNFASQNLGDLQHLRTSISKFTST